MLEQKVFAKVSTYSNIIKDSEFASSELSKLNVEDNKEKIFEGVSNGIISTWEEPSKRLVDFETTAKKEKTIDWTTQSSIGFLVFFLWLVVIQGIRTYIEEKENRTFVRLLSTPLSYNKLIVCKIISIFIYGAIQIAILLVLGKFLFNVTWFNNILGISILLAVYLFTVICMGMLFVPFVKNQRQLGTISSLIIVVTSMLGGTFFPIDIGPDIVKTIAQVTPQRWAMTSITDVALNGKSIGTQSTALIVLAAMAVVSLIISLVLINRQIRVQKG